MMQTCFLAELIIFSVTLPLTLAYTLNENLIVNGNFSEPAVSITGIFAGAPLTIPGWYCSDRCQIDNCAYRILDFVKKKSPYPNCTGQVLDIDSQAKIQNVTQNITLDYDYYRLDFVYFWPFTKSYKKTLLVYFNDQLILQIMPQLDTKIDSFYFSKIVKGIKGNNQLVFTQSEASFKYGDAVGFRINNVSLKKISNNPLQQVLNSTIDSTVSNNVNLIPGARVIFTELLNMFVNLDHYQFYYYHNRSYSVNSLTFLKAISLLLKQKGSLISRILSYTTYQPVITAFLDSLDYKRQYSSSSYLLKDETGTGFISNNATQAFMNIPIYISLILIINIIVGLLKSCYSKYLLKYTMFIIFFLMIVEGNVEQYSYYMFAELSNFFSITFRHKIVNVFLLLFFYVVILTSVGLVWFIAIHYGQRGKVLIKGKFIKTNFFHTMLEKGIICILLGAVHLFLAESPDTQIILLIGIQIFLFGFQLMNIWKEFKDNRIDSIVKALQQITMIMFQFQFYLQGKTSQASNQESKYLKATIYCFLAVWILSCLHSVMKITHFIGLQIVILFSNFFACKRVKPKSKMVQFSDKTSELQGKSQKIKIENNHLELSDKIKRLKIKPSYITLGYQIKYPPANIQERKVEDIISGKQNFNKQSKRSPFIQRPSLSKPLKPKSQVKFKSSLEDKFKNKNKLIFAKYLTKR